MKSIAEKLQKHKVLLIPLLLYFIFTIGLVFAQRPYEDEALFCNPAYNLAYHGFMGITSYEQKDDFVGLDKGVFWIPPLSMVASAGWFKVAGYGLFQQRLIAVLFGFLGILGLYYFLKALKLNDKNIFIVLLLTSVDFLYTRHSADGRICDIMCASLSFVGFGSYLKLRENNFEMALLVSNTLIVLAGLTHPNGIIGFLCLFFLILYFDRRRITIKSTLLSLAPYIIGGSAYFVYISNHVNAFQTQFFYNMNMALHGQSFLSMFLTEIKNRYLFIYFGGSNLSWAQKVLIIIPVVYLASFVYTGLTMKQDRNKRVIFFLTLINILVLTFILGKKWPRYLIYVIPLYYTCFSFVFTDAHKRLARLSVNFLIAIIAVLLIGVNVYRFKRNDYKNYMYEVSKINEIVPKNEKIIGPVELGFALGWEKVMDDKTLGYFSKKEYNSLVFDVVYDMSIENYMRKNNKIYEHQIKTIKQYTLLWQGNIYRVYRKNI